MMADTEFGRAVADSAEMNVMILLSRTDSAVILDGKEDGDKPTTVHIPPKVAEWLGRQYEDGWYIGAVVEAAVLPSSQHQERQHPFFVRRVTDIKGEGCRPPQNPVMVTVTKLLDTIGFGTVANPSDHHDIDEGENVFLTPQFCAALRRASVLEGSTVAAFLSTQKEGSPQPWAAVWLYDKWRGNNLVDAEAAAKEAVRAFAGRFNNLGEAAATPELVELRNGLAQAYSAKNWAVVLSKCAEAEAALRSVERSIAKAKAAELAKAAEAAEAARLAAEFDSFFGGESVFAGEGEDAFAKSKGEDNTTLQFPSTEEATA